MIRPVRSRCRRRKWGLSGCIAAVMLSACAPLKTMLPAGKPQPSVAESSVPEDVPEAPHVNPMADVAGDKPLPVLKGALERIDCTSGVEDFHARMALEARGGQIVSFAYYSKWKPRTCALDFERNDPKTKWRLMLDGATRVQTPQGIFVIRTHDDAYTFEFQKIPRQKFCGMMGHINGTMTVMRKTQPPACSVVGVLDANDTYLERLYHDKRLGPTR
jgi:hypothetical protein